MKFQDKFYVIFDHNKCPPSETEDEKCIFRKSYFHRIQPSYDHTYSRLRITVVTDKNEDEAVAKIMTIKV